MRMNTLQEGQADSMSAHHETDSPSRQQGLIGENPEKRLHCAYLWAKNRGDISYSMAKTGPHEWTLHIRCDFNTHTRPEVILIARSEEQLKTLIKTLFPKALRLKNKFALADFPSYPSAAIVRVYGRDFQASLRAA